MALNATPKSATANSYLTVEEADTFLSVERLYSDAWSVLTTEQKEAALIWATTLIDSCFQFLGLRTTLDQALRWPRAGAYDIEGREFDKDTVPRPIKSATANFALQLVARDRTSDPAVLGLGLSSLEVGSIKLSVDKDSIVSMIPPIVEILMQGLGTKSVNTGSSFFEAKLERS